MRVIITATLCLAGAVLLPVGQTAAQDVATTVTPQPPNALSAKQEMVRDRIARFKDRMFRLRQSLAESEPQSATKLATALEHMGRSGLEETAERLMRLLADDANLGRAADTQTELLAELENVLAVLLARGNSQARQDRIERLEQHRRDLDKLLDQQTKLRRQTAGDTVRGERARRLAEVAKRLDQIIDRQTQLQEQLDDGKPGDKTDAQAQQQLAEQTRQIAEQLQRQADSADDAQPSDAGALQKTAGDIQSGAQQMDAAQKALQSEQPSEAKDPKPKQSKISNGPVIDYKKSSTACNSRPIPLQRTHPRSNSGNCPNRPVTWLSA